MPYSCVWLQRSHFLGILNSFLEGFNPHLDFLIVRHPLTLSSKGGIVYGSLRDQNNWFSRRSIQCNFYGHFKKNSIIIEDD